MNEERGSVFPIIDPADYGLNFETDQPIASAESLVFRGQKNNKGVAVKVYYFDALGDTEHPCSKITIDRVAKLQQTTAKTFQVANQVLSPFLVGESPIQWVVNPINLIGVVRFREEDLPCTISEFVEGPNLDDDKETQNRIKGLKEPHGLRAVFYNPASALLGDATRQFQKLTGEKAIILKKWNIKAQKEDAVYKMIVTEVCPMIGKIK